MMHLLVISLGPVQDFIAQARRGRDLWFGSHMLSEISKAAANELANADVQLIFPALAKGSPDLQPRNSPYLKGGTPVFNVANRILGIVPDGVEPRDMAHKAIEAAKRRLQDFADAAKHRAGGLLAPGIDDVWKEQIDSLLEAYASWEPLQNDFAGAKQLLEEKLAGRKNLWVFSQWRCQRGNAPKSSFDGMRETVLAEPASKNAAHVRDPHLTARYRIPDGEQLDAVGVMKRVGGEPKQFVPIANVALAAWLEEAASCGTLKNFDPQDWNLDSIEREDIPFVRHFPYDAQIFYESRIPGYLEELGITDPREAEELKKRLRPIWQCVKGVTPYVACLVADGDHMGAAFDSQKNPESLQTLSKQLAKFAGEAKRIIEKEHRGVLIYAGGDDVLAFVNLVDALPCAQKLASAFTALFQNINGIKLDKTPTLSVGLGIGHVMDGMAHLLDLGRRAEKLAKSSESLPQEQKRNALGVLFDKRSGSTLSWRAQWSSDPVNTLAQDTKLIGKQISTKKIYEIQELVRNFMEFAKTPANTDDAQKVVQAIKGELRRILSRSQLGLNRSPITFDEAGLQVTPGDVKSTLEYLHAWVQRMRIAREIQNATPVYRCRETAKEANHE